MAFSAVHISSFRAHQNPPGEGSDGGEVAFFRLCLFSCSFLLPPALGSSRVPSGALRPASGVFPGTLRAFQTQREFLIHSVPAMSCQSFSPSLKRGESKALLCCSSLSKVGSFRHWPRVQGPFLGSGLQAGRTNQSRAGRKGRSAAWRCCLGLGWLGVVSGPEPFAAKCRIQLPCREPCCYCCTIGGGGQRKRRTQDMCLPPGSCRPASVLTQGLRSEPHPRPHAPTGVIAGRSEHSGGPSRWRPFTQTAVCILAGAPSGRQV